MLKPKLHLKFSIYIILTFIAFTVIGTLSHEFGHIAVAKYLGYDTRLFYGSMTHTQKGFKNDTLVKEHNQIIKQYKSELIEGKDFEKLDRLKELNNLIEAKYPYKAFDSFLVTIGGPLQTMLTSFLGLIILFVRRTKRKTDFKLIDWLAVFMSLFCLREVFNFVSALASRIIFSTAYFSGDEFKISLYFGLNQWVVPIIMMCIGLTIALYVIFKIIPLKYRFSFVVSGCIGGLLGFGIWFGGLGQLILPM